MTPNCSMTWRVLLCVLTASAAFSESPTPADALAANYPPRVEALRPTSGWASRFRREIRPAVRERVPLRVDWADNEIAESTVTFGVPFARGALPRVGNLRLVDEHGRTVPAEFRKTATWNGPNGPVRWALGHARLQRGVKYFLEFGSAVAAASTPGIHVRERSEAVVIDTGPMQVTISRKDPTVVESVVLDRNGDGAFGADEALVASAQSRAERPVVVDARGTVYAAGGAADGLRVEVVETGPQRATVRREGWYTDGDGKRFCKFVTYTYVHAGETGLRHDHTLIVAFDSNAHRIRDIMLPVPLNLDGRATAVFAADESPDGALFRRSAAEGPHRLVQHAHDAWTLFAGLDSVGSGKRAGGWFGLAGAQSGAVAGLQDFWQQYPAELEADGNVLRVHLWPAHGADVLDFRPSAILGERYPGDHEFHGGLYKLGLDEMTQAYGVGKTHNLYINFFAAAERVAAQRELRAKVVKPVLALPDPAYVCSTEAFFGRMHPYAPDRFPEEEGLIQSVVDNYYAQREAAEQYGWIHFGDVYNTGALWRRWGSMFYGFVNVMPRLYLRSGHREAWDFHRVNTRHITDIDICHLDDPALTRIATSTSRRDTTRDYAGRRYGGDGGICHYAANPYTIGCDHHYEFMVMDYYLNGNLRTWEVADAYIKVHAEARAEDSAMVRYEHRHTGGALRLFSEAYWATWNPEYLSIMRQCADILYQAREQYGVTRRDDVYMNPAKILYYQLTGDERMRDLFLNDMDAVARQCNVHASAKGGRGATLSGLAHAYWFTGDAKYLPFLAWQLEEVKTEGIEGIRGNRLGRYATFGYQLPQAMRLLSEVDGLPPPRGPVLPEVAGQPLAWRTNWAIYLHEVTDGPWRAILDVDLYGGYRRDFPNWKQWVAGLDASEQTDLLVLDPNGDVVQRIALTPDATAERIEVSVPADGKAGTYVLVPSNLVVPASVQVLQCSLDKRVVHAGENWSSLLQLRRQPGLSPVPPPSYFFVVPAGTERFGLDIRHGGLRTEVHYAVRNADGDILHENTWRASSNPRWEWDTVELDAGAPATDDVWTVTFRFPGNSGSQGETYLRFRGVPGYVASSPEELFTPDPTLRQDVPPADPPTGEGAVRVVRSQSRGDEARPPQERTTGAPSLAPPVGVYLAEGLTLESPDGQALMSEERGTVECWVKTYDSYTMPSNRNLLTCGGFRLMRRLDIGTYVYISGHRFLRFFILPNNRWTHLAVTWQPSPEENTDLDVRLYADGLEIEHAQVGFNDIAPGWAGSQMSVASGIAVSGLRVSDAVRYAGDFTRPTEPFAPDEKTRMLRPLDGKGRVWISQNGGRWAP